MNRLALILVFLFLTLKANAIYVTNLFVFPDGNTNRNVSVSFESIGTPLVLSNGTTIVSYSFNCVATNGVLGSTFLVGGPNYKVTFGPNPSGTWTIGAPLGTNTYALASLAFNVNLITNGYLPGILYVTNYYNSTNVISNSFYVTNITQITNVYNITNGSGGYATNAIANNNGWGTNIIFYGATNGASGLPLADTSLITSNFDMSVNCGNLPNLKVALQSNVPPIVLTTGDSTGDYFLIPFQAWLTAYDFNHAIQHTVVFGAGSSWNCNWYPNNGSNGGANMVYVVNPTYYWMNTGVFSAGTNVYWGGIANYGVQYGIGNRVTVCMEASASNGVASLYYSPDFVNWTDLGSLNEAALGKEGQLVFTNFSVPLGNYAIRLACTSGNFAFVGNVGVIQTNCTVPILETINGPGYAMQLLTNMGTNLDILLSNINPCLTIEEQVKPLNTFNDYTNFAWHMSNSAPNSDVLLIGTYASDPAAEIVNPPNAITFDMSLFEHNVAITNSWPFVDTWHPMGTWYNITNRGFWLGDGPHLNALGQSILSAVTMQRLNFMSLWQNAGRATVPTNYGAPTINGNVTINPSGFVTDPIQIGASGPYFNALSLCTYGGSLQSGNYAIGQYCDGASQTFLHGSVLEFTTTSQVPWMQMWGDGGLSLLDMYNDPHKSVDPGGPGVLLVNTITNYGLAYISSLLTGILTNNGNLWNTGQGIFGNGLYLSGGRLGFPSGGGINTDTSFSLYGGSFGGAITNSSWVTNAANVTNGQNVVTLGTETASGFSGSGNALTGTNQANSGNLQSGGTNGAAGMVPTFTGAGGTWTAQTPSGGGGSTNGLAPLTNANLHNPILNGATNGVTGLPLADTSVTNGLAPASALAAQGAAISNTFAPASSVASQLETGGQTDEFFGFDAGQTGMTGVANSGLGAFALENIWGGSYNTALGEGALNFNISANDNTAVGCGSLLGSTTGFNNSALGYQSGLHLSTGNNNTALGYQAGRNLTTTSNNIEIGNGGAATDQGQIRLGTPGQQTNTILSGDVSTTSNITALLNVTAGGPITSASGSNNFAGSVNVVGNLSAGSISYVQTNGPPVTNNIVTQSGTNMIVLDGTNLWQWANPFYYVALTASSVVRLSNWPSGTTITLQVQNSTGFATNTLNYYTNQSTSGSYGCGVQPNAPGQFVTMPTNNAGCILMDQFLILSGPTNSAWLGVQNPIIR